MNGSSYNNMIEKLADEITEGFQERTAAVNMASIKGLGKTIGGAFSGKNIKDAAGALSAEKRMKDGVGSVYRHLRNMQGKMTPEQYATARKGLNNIASGRGISNARVDLAKAVGGTVAAYGTAGAGLGAAGSLARKSMKNNQEELAEKAAELYDYAMNKIALSEEMYEIGCGEQEACFEVLAEAGMLDEHGIDKEAAESSDEAVQLFEIVAEQYDDSMNKIAAAEECYASSIEEAEAALEVLAELGYEL